MIPISVFAGRTVAVFGLARSGIAAADALIAGGASVAAWDDGAPSRQRAQQHGLALTDLGTADWSRFAALVQSPGVPLTHPKPHWTVERAKAAGVEVIGDTELFFRELAGYRKQHPERDGRPAIIGITGTNGKSTTTALAAHILRTAGMRVAMGGNIGDAVLGLDPFDAVDVYVLELSSYQVDLTPALTDKDMEGLCDVGILLNLTPDHLDRHGSMAHYAAVKERLIAGAAAAVVGIEDEWCRAIAAQRQQRSGTTLAISSRGLDADYLYQFVASGTDIAFNTGNLATSPVGSLAGIGALRGAHNMQNALAAIAAATLVVPDIAWDEHLKACRSFPGLAHRMQQVGSVGRTLFVNDSKATNADSTQKALASFDCGIHWIAGGRAKEGGIDSLAPWFGRIARAYLIGEAAKDFARVLDGKVAVTAAGTLAAAVEMAAAESAIAGGEPVVLFSPACASFDQFKDFEDRGNQFRKLVEALPGFVPYGSDTKP